MHRFFNLILVLSSLSLSQFTFANNPQIQVCENKSGSFFVARSQNDEIGFCRFGQAFIGALDILHLTQQHQITQAVQDYKSGKTSCQGDEATLTTPEGDEIQVCQFTDYSFISLDTLKAGLDNSINKKLNKALRLN